MNLKNKSLRYLQQALNEPAAQFRDGQWEAIEDVVRHRNSRPVSCVMGERDRRC
jgi:phenylpropionate dioxygenase-like ring-hydroxylating dioxygenase large terminal subunit